MTEQLSDDARDTKRVVIEFDKSMASYVRARLWHRTQQFLIEFGLTVPCASNGSIRAVTMRRFR